MVKYPLTGGLDLTTVKPLSRPGTLRDCLNFEVSTLDGYTRISGLARFDGSEAVGSFKLWRLRHTGAAVFAAGDSAYFDPALPGRVVETAVQDGLNVVYLLLPGAAVEPGLPATLTRVGGGTASILSRDAVFTGYGEQEQFNDGLAAIAAGQRERIGPVPGRSGSDVLGGFYYKDRLYVIRDLPRIAFENGYYTDADEGKFLTVGGLDYRILDVILTGDLQGIITLDTEPGTGTLATPIGAAELTELPVTGDLGDGYLTVPYADGLTASGGVSPYTWSLVGDEGTQVSAIEPPDANAINFLSQFTNAALYRSGMNGWERVSLGREMAFQNGTDKITNFVRSALLTNAVPRDSGVKFPGSGSVDHVVNNSMAADDGVDAALTAGQTTEFQATNFDFSSVPANATITGVEVIVQRTSAAGAAAVDMTVDLLGVPNGTHNKAKGEVWPTSPTTVTYGSATDTWNSQQLTAAVVRSSLFGVRIIAKRANPAQAMTGGIDYVQIRVTFVEKDAPIYVWNGTLDVPMTLHHTQIISGDTTNNTAQGYMSLTAPQNALKPRLVNAGDQIRTGPNGTGDLLAIVAGRDRPLWMAGQAELDNNRARYMFERTNFYGQDEFEAVYGVSGCAPAFVFDGTRCTRIRTPIPPAQDLPRHVARHGDMLALGYFPGAAIFSQPGDPLEMRGERGASSVEVGDRMTNLAPLAGDALVVVCQSSTWVIRGTVPETFQKSPISTKRGGIEYTAVDMGRYVLCDGLGIFIADAPEQFGAASRNYMSNPVHPWLEPRLQAQLNSESSFLRPVAALNVRNKNQMRLFFWDGSILTMTMTEPPQFTTQRYFTPAPNENSEPTPWVARMLCSGIDSSGRERLFVSFYGGIKEGYVFEMDAGRSFDGDPIPAQATMNPLTIDSSSRDKRYDRFHIYGTGYGYANVAHTRAINDSDVFSGLSEFRLGRQDRTAKLRTTQLRGVVDAPVEANDISLRFDSNTSTEGPFTLQYIELIADNRGQSRGRQGD